MVEKQEVNDCGCKGLLEEMNWHRRGIDDYHTAEERAVFAWNCGGSCRYFGFRKEWNPFAGTWLESYWTRGWEFHDRYAAKGILKCLRSIKEESRNQSFNDFEEDTFHYSVRSA